MKEPLFWRIPGEIFSAGFIVIVDGFVEVLLGELMDVRRAGKVSAQPAVGVFDAAFLPRSVGITEISFEAELFLAFFMSCERASVIKGDGTACALRQGFHQLDQGLGRSAGRFVG